MYIISDKNNRVVGVSNTATEAPAGCTVNYISLPAPLEKNIADYVIDGDTVRYAPDLHSLRFIAKNRCEEEFNALYNAKFFDYKNNVALPFDTELNNVIRMELNAYVKDSTSSTPVCDQLANAIGETDLRRFRKEKYDEILYHDLALASLLGQKIKMFRFIDQCNDADVLRTFRPNFVYASYSNIRWRV